MNPTVKKPTTKKETKKTKPKTESKPNKDITEIIDSPEGLETTELDDTKEKERYFEAIGRRKESTARVRLYTKKATDEIPENQGLIEVNNKPYQSYFSNKELQLIVEEPLKKLKSLNRFKARAMVSGGGLSGQAEAIKHGLARTLVEFDQNYKKKLRKAGLLTRDPREKERRKYGLKKARRAPQWSKR